MPADDSEGYVNESVEYEGRQDEGETMGELMTEGVAWDKYKVSRIYLAGLRHALVLVTGNEKAQRAYFRAEVIAQAAKVQKLAAENCTSRVGRLYPAVIGEWQPSEDAAGAGGLSQGWLLVMRAMVADLTTAEDGCRGFAGPSVVVGRLIRLGATCKEMRFLVACKGMPLLAIRIRPGCWLPCVGTPEQSLLRKWSRLAADPAELSLSQLKRMACSVGKSDWGTKADIAERLLGYLGLNMPTRIPAQICFAVKLEKKTHVYSYAAMGLESLGKRLFGNGYLAALSCYGVRKQIALRFDVYDEADLKQCIAQMDRAIRCGVTA